MRQTLNTLALDILIAVLSFLPPKSIVLVGQVAHVLRLATTCRTVWLNAARMVMAIHAVGEASYPLARLSTASLRRLALSPSNFASLVEKYNGREILPKFIRIISSDLKPRERVKFGMETLGIVSDMSLTPGGRFLLTLSTDRPNARTSTLFTLWDLGINFKFDRSIEPRARFMAHATALDIQLFVPDPVKPTTFWIVSLERLSSSITILVHKVVISTPCKISFYARHEIPTSAPSSCSAVYFLPDSHNLMVSFYFDDQSYVRIWDFVENKAADLVGLECSHLDPIHLYPYPDRILHVVGDSIAIYRIPLLEPYDPERDLLDHHPYKIVPIPTNFPHAFFLDYKNTTAAMPTLQSSSRVLRIDGYHLQAFQIADLKTNHDEAAAAEAAAAEGSSNKVDNAFNQVEGDITDARLHSAARSGYLDLCDDRLCIPSVGNRNMDVTISLLNAKMVPDQNGKVNLDFVSTKLNHKLSLVIKVQEFCPVLGRQCILADDGHVYIFEY